MGAAEVDRYAICEAGLPHSWSDFQPGYGIVHRSAFMPQNVLTLLRSRLSCDTEPWRACERCGQLITWNEWHTYDLPEERPA